MPPLWVATCSIAAFAPFEEAQAKPVIESYQKLVEWARLPLELRAAGIFPRLHKPWPGIRRNPLRLIVVGWSSAGGKELAPQPGQQGLSGPQLYRALSDESLLTTQRGGPWGFVRASEIHLLAFRHRATALAAALYGELCRQGQQHIPVYAHHSNGRVVHCDAGSPTAQDILTALEDNLNTLWQGTGRFRQMPAFQAAPTVLTPSLPILPNAGRLPLPPVPEGKPSLLRGTTRRDA